MHAEILEKRKQALIKESGLPLRNLEQLNLIPETQDIEAFQQLAYAKEQIVDIVREGNNILIYSKNPGNGKTTWAIKLGLAYIEYIAQYATEEPPLLYINLPLYFDTRKANIQDKSLASEVQRIETYIKTARLVIFDDIGVKGLSEYEKQLFYIWVEHRTSKKLSCLYTSNIHPNHFSEVFGPRIADRILGYSACVEIKGQSRRQTPNFLEVANDSITSN